MIDDDEEDKMIMIDHDDEDDLFIMKFLPTYIYTNTYMRQGLGLGKAYHCPLPSVLQFTFIMKINPTMHNNICHIHFIYTIKSTC